MAGTTGRVETPLITTRDVLIGLTNVHKVYRTGKLEYPALRGVDLEVEDGDMIAIDIPGRTLTLEVDEEELARRRAAKPPQAPRPGVTGYLARYVKLVSGAEKGAVLH